MTPDNNLLLHFDDLLCEVKKKLPEYLEDHSINVSGKDAKKFKCFYADHNDTNASVQLNYDQNSGIYSYYCYGCHKSGTIIDAYSEIESQDILGDDFKIAVMELAERYGITYNKEAPDFNKISILRQSDSFIFNDIVTYLKNSNTALDSLMSGKFGRNYSKEIAEKISNLYPFGSVDTSTLEKYLISKYTNEEYESLPFVFYGKIDNEIFSKDRLTFPIYNNSGNKVIAFGSRGSIDNEKDPTYKKYKYTYGFQKKKYPFLYHIARDPIKTSGKCYIVEGQFDALMMHAFGYSNTIALMGSSFSEEFITKLEQLNIVSINIITDSDKGGLTAAMDIVEKTKLYSIGTIVHPLNPGEDPDSLLKQGDITFIDNKIDAVEYILNKFTGFENGQKKSIREYENKLSYIIDTVKYHASWEKYIKLISADYNVPDSSVKRDLDSLYQKKDTTRVKMQKISTDISKASLTNINDFKRIIKTKLDEVVEITDDRNVEDMFSSSINYYRKLRRREIAPMKKLYTGFHEFDKSCSILTKNVTVIGGWPSHCKSSLVQYLAWGMIQDKRNENTILLYFSLDDSKSEKLMNYHTIQTGIFKKEIEKFYQTTDKPLDIIINKIDNWEALLKERLFIFGKDEDHIRTMTDIERITTMFSKTYAFHNIITVIDSIDNLDDVRTSDFQRENKEVAYGRCMTLSRESGSATIVVSHFTKKSTSWLSTNRPGAGQLKGSSAIEHDAQTILIVYNELKESKNNNTSFKFTNDNMDTLPILDVCIDKDKKHKAGGVWIPFRYDPIVGLKITECDSVEKDVLQAKRGKVTDDVSF